MNVSLRCPITSGQHDSLDVLTDIISAELFAMGATAIGEEQPRPNTAEGLADVVLVAGFVSHPDAQAALDRLGTQHRDIVSASTINAASNDWTIAQRAGLEPTQIGPWHIRAPWDPVPDVDVKHDIIIDPGAAFGHGAHPSTVMAIGLVLGTSGHQDCLVDVGTGTGVIAIIAARLGMRVEAIESDPAGAESATSNIERNSSSTNSVSELITLHVGDAAVAYSPAEDDLVVANVTLDVQRRIAPTMDSARTVILSGLLCRQVGEATALYPEHGCRTIRTHGEWASVELVRPKRPTARIAS